MRKALVECWRTAGTTSSFKYLINSGISFSIRSAASATVLLTRADAFSTLRLKSFIMLLAAVTKPAYYFALQSAGSMAQAAITSFRKYDITQTSLWRSQVPRRGIRFEGN